MNQVTESQAPCPPVGGCCLQLLLPNGFPRGRIKGTRAGPRCQRTPACSINKAAQLASGQSQECFPLQADRQHCSRGLTQLITNLSWKSEAMLAGAPPTRRKVPQFCARAHLRCSGMPAAAGARVGAGLGVLAGGSHLAGSAAATALAAGAGAQPFGALMVPCRCPTGMMWQHQNLGRTRSCQERAEQGAA